MADVFTPKKRSAIMSRIKGANTKPEILVRRIVHSLGYRFTLHNKNVTGKPDIVLPRHRKIILVNGCFWHGHANCSRFTLPSTNEGFWRNKILGNKKRDVRVRRTLNSEGWDVLVVWQCQTKQVKRLTERLKHFLEKS
jgi:DNA mismatch endonuclease (patch repair protein)